MPIPARRPTEQVTAYIGRDIHHEDNAWNVPLEIGAIPQGGTIYGGMLLIPVGFNFAPYVFKIGVPGAPNFLWEQGIGTADAARIPIDLPATKCGPVRQDAPITVTITPETPGAIPTLGHAILWLEYLPHPLTAGRGGPRYLELPTWPKTFGSGGTGLG